MLLYDHDASRDVYGMHVSIFFFFRFFFLIREILLKEKGTSRGHLRRKEKNSKVAHERVNRIHR